MNFRIKTTTASLLRDGDVADGGLTRQAGEEGMDGGYKTTTASLLSEGLNNRQKGDTEHRETNRG